MKVLSDTPTIGEPHNSQVMPMEMLQAWTTYPEIGWDAVKMKHSAFATEQGKENVQRVGNVVTVNGTVTRSHFTPDIVRVKQGDKVVFNCWGGRRRCASRERAERSVSRRTSR